jgi:hypothetical protein
MQYVFYKQAVRMFALHFRLTAKVKLIQIGLYLEGNQGG